MKFNDPCEWNLEKNRALYSDEVPHAEADYVVGAKGQWRLCKICVGLPQFRGFRKKVFIRRGK